MLNTRIRSSIVEALGDADAVERVAPSLISAFENGAGDVLLSDLGLDSLSRMELLVALELEYDAVIPPSIFAGFRSLGDIAERVKASVEVPSAAHGGDEPPPQLSEVGADSDGDRSPFGDAPIPRVVRLFLRAFRGCRTVAEMNRLLHKLSDRMSPLEATDLLSWGRQGRLILAAAPPKFSAALSDWMEVFEQRLQSSGKAAAEPFDWRRISPAAMHYFGPGDRANKTLLVCYSVKGYRTLSIPQAVFLQHVDATNYDVLVLADISDTAFRAGVPMIGSDVHQVVNWVAQLELLREYAQLRVIGCSAGAYPATLTGRRLGAEVTVGVNGRFPSERHLGTLIGMYVRSWLSSLRYPNAPIVLAHGVTKRRDVAFARRLSWLTGACRLAIEMPDQDLGHNVFQPLVEHGLLKVVLDRSLFAPIDSELIAHRRTAASLSLPVG